MADFLSIFTSRLESNRRQEELARQRELEQQRVDLEARRATESERSNKAQEAAQAKTFGLAEKGFGLQERQFAETQSQNLLENMFKVAAGEAAGTLQQGPSGANVNVPGGTIGVEAVPPETRLQRTAEATAKAEQFKSDYARKARRELLETNPEFREGLAQFSLLGPMEWELAGKLPAEPDQIEELFVRQATKALGAKDTKAYKQAIQDAARFYQLRSPFNPMQAAQLGALGAADRARTQAQAEFEAAHKGRGPQTPAEQQQLLLRSSELLQKAGGGTGTRTLGETRLEDSILTLPKEQQNQLFEWLKAVGFDLSAPKPKVGAAPGAPGGNLIPPRLRPKQPLP